MLIIATAQLMLVLDDTIAYILAFGSLLLFGGRVGDLYGRRRVFRAGLLLFTTASLLGGLGPDVESLIAVRALQGIGAALVAPNALAMIATNFAVGKARNSAMAVYGAMSALGITDRGSGGREYESSTRFAPRVARYLPDVKMRRGGHADV